MGLEQGFLRSIWIWQIIFMDLNSFLYFNEKFLEKFFCLVGNMVKVDQYEGFLKVCLVVIEVVLWDNKIGLWFDYDW